MKIYLVSYATREFRSSQIALSISAFIFGCNKLILKNKNDLIKSSFYKTNKHILDQKRGAGFWLWKYYFIRSVIEQVDDNDIIIYADSGLIFRKAIKPLVKLLKDRTDGVLLFHNNYENGQWTKRDCFIKLNCDSNEFYKSPLIFGGLQLFQKNAFSIKFIDSVLQSSCMENLICDDPCKFGFPDLPQFIEHRHDQSITSLIAHKSGITLYPDPSQFRTRNIIYKFPNEIELKGELYKNVVYVHRLNRWKVLFLPFKILTELFHKFRHS